LLDPTSRVKRTALQPSKGLTIAFIGLVVIREEVRLFTARQDSWEAATIKAKRTEKYSWKCNNHDTNTNRYAMICIEMCN
jgi:hypothetical protein